MASTSTSSRDTPPGWGCLPWRRWIDTFLDSPDDIVEWDHATVIAGHTYREAPRSVVVLFGGLDPTASVARHAS